MEIHRPAGGAPVSRQDVDYKVLGAGHYSLLVAGKSYEVFVRPDKKGYWVEVNGHLIPVRPKEPFGKPSQDEANGAVTITSPMPGRIVAVAVKEGDQVQAGQGLVVVEAMKMENELKAPKLGKVTKVAVKVGDAVEGGAELVVME